MAKSNAAIHNNKVYQETHENVMNYYVDFLDKHDKPPTCKQIQVATGVSEQTAARHIKQFKFTEISIAYKKHTPTILNALKERAAKGDVPAIKLWLQIVENWNEKTQIENTHVNKTLQISFTGSPAEVKKLTDNFIVDDIKSQDEVVITYDNQ